MAQLRAMSSGRRKALGGIAILFLVLFVALIVVVFMALSLKTTASRTTGSSASAAPPPAPGAVAPGSTPLDSRIQAALEELRRGQANLDEQRKQFGQDRKDLDKLLKDGVIVQIDTSLGSTADAKPEEFTLDPAEAVRQANNVRPPKRP